MKQNYDINGMSCSSCSANIEKTVGKLTGVNDVNANLLANSMKVDFDDKKISNEDIIKAVTDIGFGATLVEKNKKEGKVTQKSSNTLEDELNNMKNRLIISGIFLVILLYISMGHMIGIPLPSWLSGTENMLSFAFLQFLLKLPIVYVNRKYYIVGFKALFRRSPNMNSLIAIGSTAAMLYGIYAIFRIGYGFGHGDLELVHSYSMDLYFESAATILTLITLGKYLETRSKGKTSEAISNLIDLAPKIALVLKDGKEIETPIEDIIPGDIVIVKPGQTIPVEGVFIEGNSSVDQSALTGESIPIEKSVGDKVIAATSNESGAFKIKTEKTGDDTTLAQIIQLVEDASSSKAPIAKLADKISGIFVPIVIGIAIIATVIWLLVGQPFDFALSIGIAVLVISCPCALGLATPVAIMVGTGKGAENGILIKSAEALEIAHTVKTVVLDKTGTITEGKPKVTDIVPIGTIHKEKLLTIAASLEKLSEHPLADAIIEESNRKNLTLQTVEQFNSIYGQGILGIIDRK